MDGDFSFARRGLRERGGWYVRFRPPMTSRRSLSALPPCICDVMLFYDYTSRRHRSARLFHDGPDGFHLPSVRTSDPNNPRSPSTVFAVSSIEIKRSSNRAITRRTPSSRSRKLETHDASWLVGRGPLPTRIIDRPTVYNCRIVYTCSLRPSHELRYTLIRGPSTNCERTSFPFTFLVCACVSSCTRRALKDCWRNHRTCSLCSMIKLFYNRQ